MATPKLMTSERDYESDTEGSDSDKKTKQGVPKFIKKTRKALSAGLSKITLSDTTKALEIVTEQINKVMERFEDLERSVKAQEKSHDFEYLKDVLHDRRESDTRLLKTSHAMLVEMENIGKHVEDVMMRERSNTLRDSFRQSMLVVLSVSWCLLISAAPIEFFLKAFIIMTTVIAIYITGEKYLSVKLKAEARGASYVPSFSKDLLTLSETKKDCISKTVIHRESISNGKRERVTSVVVEEIHETTTTTALPKKSTKKKKKKDLQNFDPALDILQPEVLDKETVLGMSFNYLQDSGVPFSKTFEELTILQQQSFLKFKESFSVALEQCTLIDKSTRYDIPDDFNLLRFLQADKYKMKLAEKRLLKTIEFRQRSRCIDYPQMIPRDMHIYRKLRPRVTLGHDQLNRLVIYENVGAFFGNKLVPKGLSTHSWIKCYAYECQEYFKEFRKSSIQAGKAVHKFVFIADCKKCKFSNVRKLSLISTLKALEEHVPEIVGQIYVINTPSFAPMAWKFVSKILDPVVAAKIKILGSDQCKVLNRELGKDVVPVAYKGENAINLPE